MSSYFAPTFLSANMLEVALLFFVGGMVILLRSLQTQDKQIGEQKRVIVQLGEQLQNCIDQQITVQEHLSSLHEQCSSLNARQQLVEKHGSDVQRIDLAMRMLKRGVGSAETLHDLGLSNSEIKLLLRLHSAPTVQNEPSSKPEKMVPSPETESARPTAIQQDDPFERVDDVEPSGLDEVFEPVSVQVSEQGQELAKLFETRVAS